MTMTYAEFKAKYESLEAAYKAASEALAKHPRLSNGLPANEVRLSPNYRADKAASNAAFEALRDFNDKYAKRFAKEIKADIQAKREASL